MKNDILLAFSFLNPIYSVFFYLLEVHLKMYSLQFIYIRINDPFVLKIHLILFILMRYGVVQSSFYFVIYLTKIALKVFNMNEYISFSYMYVNFGIYWRSSCFVNNSENSCRPFFSSFYMSNSMLPSLQCKLIHMLYYFWIMLCTIMRIFIHLRFSIVHLRMVSL